MIAFVSWRVCSVAFVIAVCLVISVPVCMFCVRVLRVPAPVVGCSSMLRVCCMFLCPVYVLASVCMSPRVSSVVFVIASVLAVLVVRVMGLVRVLNMFWVAWSADLMSRGVLKALFPV